MSKDMGCIDYRKKWKPTQVNIAYKFIKRKMDRIQIGVSWTKGGDNCKSFKINNILENFNNDVNEYIVQAVRESSIIKEIVKICNVLLISNDQQKKNFVIVQIKKLQCISCHYYMKTSYYSE